MENCAKGNIAIVGAGPIGMTTAILLAQRGYQIEVYEKRSFEEFESPPDSTKVLGTSFTKRGQDIVKLAGLTDVYGVELKQTQIHLQERSYKYYMGREGDVFYSLNRAKLIRDLHEKASSFDNVKFFWKHKVESVDPEKAAITFEIDCIKGTKHFEVVFAADGCYSSVRKSLQYISMMDYTQEHSKIGYMYIEIPSKSDSSYSFDQDCFHIFPRDNVFVVVLPEPLGKFSASFYFPWDGSNSYTEKIKNNELLSYIKQNFNEIYQVVPDFEEQLTKKSLRKIMAVKLDPWYIGKVCFIGDAAHGLFPFYGSGLNVGLEDVGVLIELIDQS